MLLEVHGENCTLQRFLHWCCVWSGQSGLNCWIAFTPVFSCITVESLSLFYLLFLYILWDDTSISWGSYMWTKHLFVLIHNRNKGEVGSPSVKDSYWPFQGSASFVNHFCYLCFVSVMLSCLIIADLWSTAGKGLTSLISCMWYLLVFLLLSHIVSWVRWGTWLYWFLIFAYFVTCIA